MTLESPLIPLSSMPQAGQTEVIPILRRPFLNKAQRDELYLEIARSPDTKKALLFRLGDLSGLVAAGNKLLVATYIAPEMTMGGIILPTRTLEEDRFQGIVGLVVKKGPLAYVDDNIAQFKGFNVDIGEYAVYRPSDGIETFVRGVPCRWIEDTKILGKTDDPLMVF